VSDAARLRRLALASTIAVGATVAVAGIASVGVAAAFARTVVTPPRRRPEEERVIAVTADTITLAATIDALTPGRYSFWFDRDVGHARVGEILEWSTDRVTRVLLGVDFGSLTAGRRGRFSGWYYLSPGDVGVPWRDVEIETEFGPAPAWLVTPPEPSDRWVIQVHGRAVRRQEALRAIPVFRRAGYTSLLISYRNDGDAPASPDGRYALGDTEWRDVEAAMRFAVDHGARELVLMGWSMGGATVLQALTRSPVSALVRGVVLESPVVDWVTALQFIGELNRLPGFLQRIGMRMLAGRWARELTGVGAPVNFARMDLVARAAELDRPILLLHSVDDGFVPATASQALAAARPDIVTFESFVTARHTKLWNYDETRWTSAIERWLSRLG
jgi:alpha-beta hydrolase superfamily lysophospholipase